MLQSIEQDMLSILFQDLSSGKNDQDTLIDLLAPFEPNDDDLFIMELLNEGE